MPIDEQDPYAWVDEEVEVPAGQVQNTPQDDPYAWVDEEQPLQPQDPEAEIDLSPLESIIPDIESKSLAPFEAAKKIGTGLKDLLAADTTTTYKLSRMTDNQALLYAKYAQFRDPAYLEEAQSMEQDITALSQQIPEGTGNRMVQGAAGFLSMMRGMQEKGVEGFKEGKAAVEEVLNPPVEKTAESNKIPGDMAFSEAEMPTNLLGSDGLLLSFVRKAAGPMAVATGVPMVNAGKEMFWDYAKEVAVGRAFREIRSMKDPRTGEPIPDDIAVKYAEKIGIASATIQNVFLMGGAKLLPGFSAAVQRATTEAAASFTSSELFKGVLLKQIEGAALFGAMSGADAIANEIGTAFAKHEVEALQGFDLPEKSVSEIVSTVMKSVNSGMEQSVGVSMLGLSKEAIVRQVKSNALAKEAQFNVQREAKQMAAEVLKNKQEITSLEKTLPVEALRVERDGVAEGLRKKRFIDNFLQSKEGDLNTVLEEGLFAPERNASEYSIKEYRDAQVGVNATRTTVRALRSELAKLEDSPANAPQRADLQFRLEKAGQALESQKVRVGIMERAKRQGLQNALIKGTLSDNVEALAVDGSGTGISVQELAIKKEALRGKKQEVQDLQKEKQDAILRRIDLENQKNELIRPVEEGAAAKEENRLVYEQQLKDLQGEIESIFAEGEKRELTPEEESRITVLEESETALLDNIKALKEGAVSEKRLARDMKGKRIENTEEAKAATLNEVARLRQELQKIPESEPDAARRRAKIEQQIKAKESILAAATARGKIKETLEDIARINAEIKDKKSVADTAEKELNGITKKTAEESARNLERVHENLKKAEAEGEKAFIDPLSQWIEAQGMADIGRFRLELKEAWVNANASRRAGGMRGYNRAEAAISQKMDLLQARQDLRFRQKQVISDITGMIKKGSATKGKLDADGQAFFSALKPFTKESTELTWKEHNDLMTAADNGDPVAGLKLDVWQMREQARNGDFSFLESLHGTIKGVLDGSIAARDAYLGARMLQQKLDTAKIVKEVRGDFEVPRGSEKIKDRVKRTLSFFGWNMMYDARSMLAAFTQDSGRPFEETMAYRKMEDIDQSKARDGLIKKHTENLLKTVIDAVGIKPKFDPVLGKEIISAEAQALLWLERERIAPRNPLIGLDGKPVLEAHRSLIKNGVETIIPGDPNKFMFNPSELRCVYALLKEPKSRAQLERQGYTPDIAEAVFNAIDNNPVEKSIVYGLQDVFKQVYPEANVVYRKLNGRDLGEKDFYMHVVRKRSGTPVSVIETQLGEGYRRTTAESFGALKEMTDSHLEIAIQPDIQVAREYIKQMSQYIAYAEWARDASAIFRSSDFTEAIKRKWGDDFGGRTLGEFQKMLDNTIRGYRAPNQTEIGWINKTMSVAVKTTLAAKAKLTLGQMSSNVLYLDKMSVPEYVAGLNEFAKNPKAAMAFIDERSSYFSSRTWRTDQSLLAVSQGLQPGLNRKWNDVKFWLDHATDNIFMKNIVWGDKLSSYAGGYAMYRALRKQGVPEREAMRKAEIYTRDTQQSSEMSAQSNTQAGGTYDRLMTVYASQQLSMYRVQQKSIRDAFNAEGRYRMAKAKFEDGKIASAEFAAYEAARKSVWKASAKTGLIFSVLEPMLFAYIASGFNADPDEMKAATLSTFYSFPIAGNIFEGVVRKSLGLPVYGEGTVLGDFLDNWRKATEDIIAGESDTLFRDAATVLQSFPAMGGVPLKTMVDILGGGEDIIVEGEPITGVKKVMGYSPAISEE